LEDFKGEFDQLIDDRDPFENGHRADVEAAVALWDRLKRH